VAGVRVGVPIGHFFDDLEPDVARAVQDAIALLRELGATVLDVDVDGLDGTWAADATRPELGQRYAADIAERPEAFDPGVLRKLRAAMAPSLADHLSARRESERVAAAFRRELERVHLVAVPTTPIVAPLIGVTEVERDGVLVDIEDVLISFTRVFSLLRVPALSVPCGATPAGLPVGLQLVGKPFDEATLIRVGHALATALGSRAG
jgi:aspartyl-tRNA(Asn)/glutamyl-tRNA(Gln) amidotransferase subunit A